MTHGRVIAVTKMGEPTQEQLDWRGEFDINDCEERAFTPDVTDDTLRRAFANAACELVHKPSGMSVIAQGAMDYAENRKRAERALRNRMASRRVVD